MSSTPQKNFADREQARRGNGKINDQNVIAVLVMALAPQMPASGATPNATKQPALKPEQVCYVMHGVSQTGDEISLSIQSDLVVNRVEGTLQAAPISSMSVTYKGKTYENIVPTQINVLRFPNAIELNGSGASVKDQASWIWGIRGPKDLIGKSLPPVLPDPSKWTGGNMINFDQGIEPTKYFKMNAIEACVSNTKGNAFFTIAYLNNFQA